MQIPQFDELNIIDVKKYFDEMELSKKDKEIRVRAAFDLIEDIWFLYVFLYVADGDFDYYYILTEFESRLAATAAKYTKDDEFISEYSYRMGREMLDSSIKALSEGMELDSKRASIAACNESNSILNHEDLRFAIEKGYRWKTWVTMKDRRVRPTHKDVDEKTIPIEAFFDVGSTRMLYPHDAVNGSMDELANCRCTVIYS